MSLFIKISGADRAQARPGDVSPPSRRPLAVSGKMRAMMSLFIKGFTFSSLAIAGEVASLSSRRGPFLPPYSPLRRGLRRDTSPASRGGGKQ